MSADQTGYKKPPVKNQFKKGQSGNPKGKPKGFKSLKATFEEVLRQPVRIRQGDRQMWLTRLHAMFVTMTTKAMQGDSKAFQLVLGVAEKFQMLSPAPSGAGADTSSLAWTEEDESLRPYFEHLRNSRSGPSTFKGGPPDSSSENKNPEADKDDES
jgi:hypothetical protein